MYNYNIKYKILLLLNMLIYDILILVIFMEKEYKIGSIVTMKKPHPCGTNEWIITRMGVDIKIKCIKCERCVMIPRIDFNKKLKKVVKYEE